MHVTRRYFGRMLSGLSGMTLSIAPLLLRPASATPTGADAVVERRVYDRAGAVPPASVMRKCGIRLVASENAGTTVVLTVSFRSLAERACVWDRFNSDPEWCALREAREVRLREIAILPFANATV
jgi:hypothetical protein